MVITRFFLLTLPLLAPPVVSAAPVWGECVFEPDGKQVATLQCLVPLFERVVSSVLALSGVALFVMLIIGGYNFLFSGGDQKKLEVAKGTLTNAIIGLVVIVLAYLIIYTIRIFTGVDKVTEFTIPWWR